MVTMRLFMFNNHEDYSGINQLITLITRYDNRIFSSSNYSYIYLSLSYLLFIKKFNYTFFSKFEIPFLLSSYAQTSILIRVHK